MEVARPLDAAAEVVDAVEVPLPHAASHAVLDAIQAETSRLSVELALPLPHCQSVHVHVHMAAATPPTTPPQLSARQGRLPRLRGAVGQ
jgi:hypothetical protein